MLNPHNEKKKLWWLEVAKYGEHSYCQVLSCVSMKVIFERVVLFNIYHKYTTKSRSYDCSE